jgi:hypothetical protein
VSDQVSQPTTVDEVVDFARHMLALRAMHQEHFTRWVEQTIDMYVIRTWDHGENSTVAINTAINSQIEDMKALVSVHDTEDDGVLISDEEDLP